MRFDCSLWTFQERPITKETYIFRYEISSVLTLTGSEASAFKVPDLGLADFHVLCNLYLFCDLGVDNGCEKIKTSQQGV